MDILVTGGSGFLGKALCTALLARGHAVNSYQRGFSAELETLGVRQLLGDLTDADALVAACAGRDAALHTAATAAAAPISTSPTPALHT